MASTLRKRFVVAYELIDETIDEYTKDRADLRRRSRLLHVALDRAPVNPGRRSPSRGSCSARPAHGRKSPSFYELDGAPGRENGQWLGRPSQRLG